MLVLKSYTNFCKENNYSKQKQIFPKFGEIWVHGVENGAKRFIKKMITFAVLKKCNVRNTQDKITVWQEFT
jgi:hypothetical protein